MKKTILFLISLSLSAFSYAKAVTHDLADSGGNICDDSGVGQLDGTVYRCSTGSLTLRNGDSVIYSGNSGGKPITLEVMHGDITLEGNNSVGSQQQRINLKTSSASSSLQVMKPSENKKNKKKDSNGYRDIVIKNGSTVWGDIYAHNDVTIKNSVIRGNITSDGGGVITEASGNKIFGNVTALHAVAIKQALVCGTLESKGLTVTVENSKTNGQGDGGGNHNGVFALHDAIKSHGWVALKQADICGLINSQANLYSYKNDRRYCGVNDPNCNYAPAGKCSISNVKAICGWEVEPEPKQCKPLPPENFDNGSLANWSVMGFGESDNPVVSDQRFILNSNKQYQATASAYNYVFPSDQNYLEIEFDHYAYGGNGADGVALVISDASVPPKTGAFGGPLGYGMKLKDYPHSDVTEDTEGFAGGWLGIGIDEYGNFRREGGEQVTRNAVADNVVVRGAGAQDSQGKWLKGYPFITEKKYSGFLDNRRDQRHRYKVVLNSRDSGSITLSVWRKVGDNEDWGEPVIEEFDLLTEGGFNYIPENFRLSVTASTGYDTNTHAVDNFQVCADKYQKITNGIHHFEFDYSGSGSTCQASDVTLRACMNESCSEQYPSDAYDEGSLKPLSVTLLPSAGNNVANWVGGTNIQFKNETQLSLQGSRAGEVTLGVAQSSVPQFGFDGARCRKNGGPLSVDNCIVTFAQSVLAVNVGDVVASRETAADNYLSFCSTRTEEQGESRGVNISIEYEIAPVDSSQPVLITYKKKVGDNDPEWSPTVEVTKAASKYLPNVYFDGDGKAYFKLKYAEAGKVKLKASVEGVDDSEGFDSFVSFPSKLKVTAKSGDKSGECTNSENGCSSGFVAAGEVFELTISALQDDGSVAENYQEKTITVSNKVKYPSNGSLAKLLNERLPEPNKWSNGSVTFDQSVSEVGAFELIAEAPVAKDENGDDIGTSLYLGSKAFKIADGKSTIGRFYPDYFKVTGTEWTYPDNQNDSVYMGQNFASVKFEVTAYNADGYATQNYGSFADSLKADLHLAGSFSDRLSILDSDLTSKNWSGAIWSKTWVNSVDWSKAVNLDGPFNSKVSTDSSTESSIALSLNNTASTKTAHIDPTLFLTEGHDGKQSRTVEQQLLSQPDVRYGRMVLDDIGGRQGDTLSIPLKVEYWNKNRFVVNSKDNRTAVSAVEQGDDKLIWSSPDGVTACDINIQVLDSVDSETSSAKVTGGILPNANRERLTAVQGCDNEVRQQSQVWLDLDDSENGLPWLKYDWDNDGSEENPSSVVTFGIHRGNDRVIYRGEPGLTGQ
ncbi:TPA: hypothetical protein NGS41_003894 [Vibrio parahaemolyticus]|nr:hypothetical protein [Vibrio parahaemolyticus]